MLVKSQLVHSAQSSFGPELRRTFAEVIDPRLVTLLQEQLQPVASQLLKDSQATSQQYSEIMSKLDSLRLQRSQPEISTICHDRERSQAAAVETIKEHITSAINGLRDGTPMQKLQANHKLRSPLDTRQSANPLNHPLETLQAASENQLLHRGSLEELYGFPPVFWQILTRPTHRYYLILVYLGYFLRDLLWVSQISAWMYCSTRSHLTHIKPSSMPQSAPWTYTHTETSRGIPYLFPRCSRQTSPCSRLWMFCQLQSKPLPSPFT